MLRGGGGPQTETTIAPPAPTDWTLDEVPGIAGDVIVTPTVDGPGNTPGYQARFQVNGGGFGEMPATDSVNPTVIGAFTAADVIEVQIRWCDMPSENPISDWSSSKTQIYA